MIAVRMAPVIAKPAPTRKAVSKPLVSATVTLWTPECNALWVRLLAIVEHVLEVKRQEEEHREQGHADQQPDDVRAAQGPQAEDRERHQWMPLAQLDDHEQGEQRQPGLRLSDSVFEPPWNVGVAPTTEPEADATVKLCSSDAVFVKPIVTLPALAVSELASNFSWPPGSAASFSVGPPASLPTAGAGVEELELEVVGAAGALVGADAEELAICPGCAQSWRSCGQPSGAPVTTEPERTCRGGRRSPLQFSASATPRFRFCRVCIPDLPSSEAVRRRQHRRADALDARPHFRHRTASPSERQPSRRYDALVHSADVAQMVRALAS
jgi:hypothetical protein